MADGSLTFLTSLFPATNDTEQTKMKPAPQAQKQRIAIIGAGVSGLSAAWHLHTSSDDIDVTLFESDSRLGGHAHTLTLDTDKMTAEEYVNGNGVKNKGGGDRKENKVDVDVGFMVYNKGNYPNMTAWVS